jgi:hypothetical protein
MKIPKNLHFVFDDDEVKEPISEECVASWKRIHRLYTVHIWTKSKDFNMENAPLSFSQQRPETLGLEMLFKHGGFLVDPGIFCLNHIERFLDPNSTLLLCHETSELWKRQHGNNSNPSACNMSFIGARQGELLFIEMLTRSAISMNAETFGKEFLDQRVTTDKDLQVLPPQALYEILWNHPPLKILKWAKQIENKEGSIDEALQRLAENFTKGQILGMQTWLYSNRQE